MRCREEVIRKFVELGSAGSFSISDAETQECYEYVVRHCRNYIVKDPANSTNRCKVYVISDREGLIKCALGDRRKGAEPVERISLAELISLARGKFYANPPLKIKSLREKLEDVVSALGKGKHVLMVGEPDSGNTLILNMFDYPSPPLL